MRDKIFDEIKIFALNVYIDKIDYGDVVEYLMGYEDKTVLVPGAIIDGVAINLLSQQIYPVLHNLSDGIVLGTPYITYIYNYGERIQNDTGYYLLDLEPSEAKEYYNKAKNMIEHMKEMEANNVIWFEKEKAKILENKLYR